VKDDFSLPVPTLRRAPFRHRSSTVQTTVQTRAIHRSAPFNGRGDIDRSPIHKATLPAVEISCEAPRSLYLKNYVYPYARNLAQSGARILFQSPLPGSQFRLRLC